MNKEVHQQWYGGVDGEGEKQAVAGRTHSHSGGKRYSGCGSA